MTPAELKARIEAARAFEVEAEGIVFACVVPSKLDMRSGFRAHSVGGVLDLDAFLLGLVPRHVRGWRGATQGHLVAGLEAAEATQGVEFEAGLLLELFAARPDVYDAVAGALVERYKARDSALEETLKN